ncbi:MAG: Arc family DNA-binding protein [Deltaproteobacteria bacterium]|nr:Arc family DNA-binding protein [Deltaproteobacteria bacterium]
MPAITVKRVPDELHRLLKERADEHGRSLNSEIIACLKAALEPQVVDPEALLVRARALRQGLPARLTDRALRRLKDRGRP